MAANEPILRVRGSMTNVAEHRASPWRTCLRRPGLPALDPGAPGCRPPFGGPLAAHRRQPDHARPVQLVRPVGRSSWTGRARPGRDEPARGEARPAKPQHDEWPHDGEPERMFNCVSIGVDQDVHRRTPADVNRLRSNGTSSETSSRCCFTPKRSLVRSQYRPPIVSPGQIRCDGGPSSSSSPS